jgi:hypothetical protein
MDPYQGAKQQLQNKSKTTLMPTTPASCTSSITGTDQEI